MIAMQLLLKCQKTDQMMVDLLYLEALTVLLLQTPAIHSISTYRNRQYWHRHPSTRRQPG